MLINLYYIVLNLGVDGHPINSESDGPGATVSVIRCPSQSLTVVLGGALPWMSEKVQSEFSWGHSPRTALPRATCPLPVVSEVLSSQEGALLCSHQEPPTQLSWVTPLCPWPLGSLADQQPMLYNLALDSVLSAVVPHIVWLAYWRAL